MSRKLWTSAVLLAAITGTGALTPVRASAQVATPNSTAAPAGTTPVETAPAAPDPAVVLADPNQPQWQRDEAARKLLSRHTEQANTSLRSALIELNFGGRSAVARALAEDTQPDPSFIDPLFPLLQNRETADEAARALSGFKADPSVLSRLIAQASNRRAGDWTRNAAIRALGTMSEKRAAATLMELIDSDESTSIHSNAAQALVNLTGLEQNGQDLARWRQWWAGEQNRADVEFRQAIAVRKDVRLDRLSARYRSLTDKLYDLLYTQFLGSAKDQREAFIQKLLASSEPDFREIGARIALNGFLDGATITDAEKQRLRDMIGDSNPAVRRAVADALSKINYAGALDALLEQLKTEPDPTVRAAIATALGPIHNLRAVPTLLNLLSDDSLPTARAAAQALADLATRANLINDAKQARETALRLRDAIIKSMQTPGAEDLRADCVKALAPLKQPDIVQELLKDKLLDPFKEPSWSVRKYMLQALGELNDRHLADPIAGALGDPSANVRLQAIQSLSTNPSAADWAERVGHMLDPNVERDASVRDAAWQFLLSVFPQLGTQQLQNWADVLKNEPEKQVLALQVLAEKQQRNGSADDLAVTRQSIGLAYMASRRYGDAAASFRAALDLANAMPGAMRDSLENDYMQSLLLGGRFAEAVSYAADRIRTDQREQSTMGPIIVHFMEQLAGSTRPEDITTARQLLDLARKMTPPLGDRYQHQMDGIEADLKKGTVNRTPPSNP